VECKDIFGRGWDGARPGTEAKDSASQQGD
jgi:hypothetical protein